jgi:glycosyltransferase involved in cell wall biosynthesis
MSNKSLLFDFSAVSGCFYAPPGNHYGVGRVNYGFARQLAMHYPDRLGISSGDFSAECRPFLNREFPELSDFCVEPQNHVIESAFMRWVDLGNPSGEMRIDNYSKVRRALWRPYDNQLRWQRSQKTKGIYRHAKLIHSEFPHPVSSRCPKAQVVYTIHDLIGVTGTGVSKEDRNFKTNQYRSAWESGAHFVCDSKYTGDCLKELVGHDERIGWSGLGLDSVFKPTENSELLAKWKGQMGINYSQRYVVAHTGEIERKNLISVIKVVDRMRAELDRDLILLFVGYPKQLRTEFDRCLPPSIQWRDFVRFSGNLSDGDFPIIYSGAELMLFLSLAEGFGLPALEGMGCGVPLVCSNRTSLPEVVGNGGLLVDPTDIDSVFTAASEVFRNRELRDSLRFRGLLQANSLSWKSAGNRLKDIWENALASQ